MLKLKKNVSLKSHTAFKIGGPAKYFFEAKIKDDIIKAVNWAESENLPFFILGKGSNILAADEGYEGLVIKFQLSSFKFQDNKIICGAGLSLTKLVNESAKAGLTGLEWVAGIPGTIGGAIAGNAGAFNFSMADIVSSVEVLAIVNHEMQNSKCKFQNESSKLKIKNFTKKDCRFGYRDSGFKDSKNLIILSAVLELERGDKKEIQKKIKEYLSYRKEKQPLELPSAGSVFKNYESRIMNYELFKKYPELKEFDKKEIIPAAYLIEKCGLKGKKIGKAMISEKHGNFIVNLGGAKAKDVLDLINLAKREVKERFGIELEEEIRFLGF